MASVPSPRRGPRHPESDVSALYTLALGCCLVFLLMTLPVVTGAESVAASSPTAGRPIVSNDSANTTATLPKSIVREHRGDIVTVPVSLDDGYRATLALEARGVDYRSTLQLVDGNGDGRVVVRFNTYTVGHGDQWASETFATANRSDTVRVLDRNGTAIERRTDPDGQPLDARSYALRVWADDRAAASVGRIALDAPAVHDLTVWSAPRDTSAESISAPVDPDDDPVTRTHSTAMGDLLVLELRASGIEGAIDHAGGLTAAIDGPGIRLNIEQNASNTGPSSRSKVLELGPENTTAITDAANDTYVLVVDTGAGVNGQYSRELRRGDEYTASLFMRERESNGSAVKTAFEVVEPQIRVSETNAQGLAVVRPSTNQTVEGSTTLLPGTELSVVIEAPNGTRWTGTTTVGPERTFSVPPSLFEGVPPQTRLRIDIRAGERASLPNLSTIVAAGKPTRLAIDHERSNRTVVTLDSVILSKGGFVTVYRTTRNPPVIGNSTYLPPGTNRDVTVRLAEAVSNGTVLYVTPTLDYADDRVFDLGETTVEYERNGEPITRRLVVGAKEAETTTETPAGTDRPSTTALSSATEANESSVPTDGGATTVTTSEVTTTETMGETTTTETTGPRRTNTTGPGLGIESALLALAVAGRRFGRR